VAKKSNGAVLAQKRKNNKVGMLICSSPSCDNEFYIAYFRSGLSKRVCPDCYAAGKARTNGVDKTRTRRKSSDHKLLASLGLV
jgi:hypothetical protein